MYSLIFPLSSTHCSDFCNPSNRNSFGCAANVPHTSVLKHFLPLRLVGRVLQNLRVKTARFWCVRSSIVLRKHDSFRKLALMFADQVLLFSRSATLP
jgi:hypothetical protein